MAKKGKLDPEKPSLQLLIKLGSIIVHTQELHSHCTLAPGANQTNQFMADTAALGGVMNDPEVKDWLAAMDAEAYLPVKR